VALDLSTLEQQHSRWIVLRGALDGFEVEIKHRTMKERERFENKMVRDGVMKKEGGGVNPGRMDSLISAFAHEVIVGWKVPDRFRAVEAKDENPPYSADEFAKILNASPASLDHILEEIREEASFFCSNGNGSTG
jgi:hypothetical protein